MNHLAKEKVKAYGKISLFHHFYERNNVKGIIDEYTGSSWIEEYANDPSIEYEYKGQKVEPFFNYRAG